MPPNIDLATPGLPPEDTAERLLELFERYRTGHPPFNSDIHQTCHVQELPVSVSIFRAVHERLQFGDLAIPHRNTRYNYYPPGALLTLVRPSTLHTAIAAALTRLLAAKLAALDARHPASTPLASLITPACPARPIPTTNGTGVVMPSCAWYVRGHGTSNSTPAAVLDVCDADSFLSAEVAARAVAVLRRKKGAVGWYARLEIGEKSAWVTAWAWRGGAARTRVGMGVRRTRVVDGRGEVVAAKKGMGLGLGVGELLWMVGDTAMEELEGVAAEVWGERMFVGYDEIAGIVRAARESLEVMEEGDGGSG